MNSSEESSVNKLVFHIISAPFWKRVAAYLVDQLIVAGMFLSLILLDLYQLPAGTAAVTDITQINILFNLAYFTVLEGAWGQSPGKKVLSITVREEDGSSIDFKTALLRRIGLVVPVFSLIDAGAILFTSKNQRIFDVIADTLVLKKDAEDDAVKYLRTGEVSGKLERNGPVIEGPSFKEEEKNWRNISGLVEKRKELNQRFEDGEIDEDRYRELKKKYDSRIRTLEEKVGKTGG